MSSLKGEVKLIIASIIIVVVGALWFYLSRVPDTILEIAPGEELRRSGRGVVSGFPSELLLERGVKIVESYSIKYEESSVFQPVVTYESELELRDNLILYANYFENNDWTIIKEADLYAEGSTSYLAVRGGDEVNVLFSNPGGEGVLVTLSYLKR